MNSKVQDSCPLLVVCYFSLASDGEGDRRIWENKECSPFLFGPIACSKYVHIFLLIRSSYSSGPQMFNVKFPTSEQVFEFMIWKALFPHLSNSIPFAFLVQHMFPLNMLLELK